MDLNNRETGGMRVHFNSANTHRTHDNYFKGNYRRTFN